MPAPTGERSWLRVTVFCRLPAVDAVTAVLQPISPNGACLEDGEPASVTVWLGPYKLPPHTAEVTNEVRSRLECIPETLLPRPVRIEADVVPEKDWVEVFRAQYRPVRIGHIVIKPTWEPWPSEHLAPRVDDIVVDLDPGLAFGTGLHPTTRSIIVELQERVRRGARVIDFGCGSGILSIAAAKLGAAEVLAIDCDPSAVEVARENIRCNAVEDRVIVQVGDTLADVGGGWHIIAANINPPVIVEEAPAALAALRPGGAYLCAGIPVSREAEVLEALREVGFAGILPRVQGEWIGFVCVAPADKGGHG